MIDLICIASGPSLTVDDCAMVRRSGIKTVAVNNSWEMARFCDYLYAGDRKWWAAHHEKINIPAERWTCSKKAVQTVWGLNYHQAGGSFNSGMRAIQWGIDHGFKSIALLGYDCSIKHGLHWHGPHTERLLKNPTEERIHKWHDQFARVAKQAEKYGVEIFNCSRRTDLTSFPRMRLEDAVSIASLSASLESAKARGCDLGGHWM